MQRVNILGVPVDPVTQDEAVMRISQMLTEGGKRHIMTPNNEMIVAAQKDSTFKSLLQSSDLNIPDSTGLLWAAKRTGQVLPERVTGVDTVERILQSLSSEHPVFFLGGQGGVGERAAEKLEALNPKLEITTFEGTPSEEDAAEIIKRINDSGAHLLLVAYGAPKQDLWINQHVMQLTSVRVAMGVGGTFDFLSGSIKRAPKWMRSLGLEWLWRLIVQPSRIGRIYTAVIRFPLLVLRG
ncbi:MAG: WecB/TagA/CpsF family glycosyltransferase [Candidatus Peribacteraceae bacterium]|jgi:N-acetylglucosaminyldiphosphoundecaprenol N-acetyl-beta-D-mannosaminyltransferase|nr:WecB/TagA/CpsF family glycosyltransferase [Candidatus Peribacteraceae bacterium]|tara:strand:+ start:15862 stop:16578 length:717 start_codon:yes stop_codon:yes gene_type:complete